MRPVGSDNPVARERAHRLPRLVDEAPAPLRVDATAKIVGIVDNRAIEELQTDATLCTQFATATSKFWIGEPGKKGKVFCLEPITK